MVKLDEYNTLNSVDNVTAANRWAINLNNLNDICTTNLMGYAIYQGNYILNNYTHATPFALNPPNLQNQLFSQ